MAISRCPLCGSPCILKIITTEDTSWCKVDVCEMCQTMYPRGRQEVRIAPSKVKAKPTKAAKRRKGKK